MENNLRSESENNGKVINDMFVNEDLHNKFSIKLKTLDELLEFTNISIAQKVTIQYLFDTMKKLPASVRGYHGGYKGGLYDHVILVTNFVYLNYVIIVDPDFTLEEAILSALYHDIQKIISYAPKRNVEFNFKIGYYEEEAERYRIHEKYSVSGRDKHVEGCLALITKVKLKMTDNIEKAIIWHHGGWSYFKPHRTNKLSALLHGADMIASQTLDI